MAVGCLIVALTAGCGARWDEGQRAAVLAHVDGSAMAADPAPPARTGTRAASTATATAGPVADAGGTAVAGGDGGAAEVPVVGAAAGDGAGPASAPCAAPSDAPGVSADTITLGAISSLTGPVPGLGASAAAAVRAYVAYRNATGGVCGRQLDLREGDDGTDNGRHRALVNEMSDQVLGIAGGAGFGDAGSAQLVDSIGMPVIATAMSEPFQNASAVFDIYPPYVDLTVAIGKYRFLHDQGVRRAAIVFIAGEAARAEALGRQRPLMEAAGIEVVLEYEFPVSTLSFDSTARAVANSGADYLTFFSESGHSAAMARAMADTGYELRFQEYLAAYGSNFLGLAGDASEGVTSWIRTLPMEDAGSNPELDAFLEWMATVAPGDVTDTFAADSWAAAKAFVDAVEALRGPISRETLLAQLRSVTTYDAGGFLGPIQLGAERGEGCAVAMIVQGGAWRRLTPANGFLC